LINYFETQDIEVSLEQSTLKVSVKNSSLVKSKMNESSKNKEYHLEQFASSGALLTAMSLDSNILVDSVLVNIEGSYGNGSYAYSLSDVKQVRQNADICIQFIHELKSGEYSRLKAYLSQDIVRDISEDKLKQLLAPFYSSGNILDAKLI